MDGFKFKIGDRAQLIVSGESGRITGMSLYEHGGPQYFLHYKAADGRAVSQWWDESNLEPVPEGEEKTE